MNRILAIGIALALVAAPPSRESVRAEVKAKASTSSKTPQAQRNKKPKSLYFPEPMIGKKKDHPDFMWLPRSVR